MGSQQASAAEKYRIAAQLMARPNGATVSDIKDALGIGKVSAQNRLCAWRRDDRAFSIRWPSESSPALFFVTSEQRDAFVMRMGDAQPSYVTAALRMVRERAGQPLTYAEFVNGMAVRNMESNGTLARMVKAGQLVAVRVGRDMAYFETDAAAKAWLAAGGGRESMPRYIKAQAAAPKPQHLRVQPGKPGHQLVTPPRPSVPAGVTIHRPAPVVEVDASGAKITRDLARWPTARWQMRQDAPDERWPLFVSIPLGAFAMGAV